MPFFKHGLKLPYLEEAFCSPLWEQYLDPAHIGPHWSPRQKKYFEVCSCTNMGDAQARRLKIRVKGGDGKNYLPHTLNNTVVAPPRMLIAFLENNLQADGSVKVHPSFFLKEKGSKRTFYTATKPCLINGGMPKGERFFRQSRRIFAGGLTPGKKMSFLNWTATRSAVSWTSL